MKKKNKFDKWFLLTGKNILIIAISWFLAVILHNVFYALSEISGKNLGIGEGFFFFIAILVIPIYFLISFTYTLIKMVKDKTLFQESFIIKVLIAIILGAIVTLLVIKFNFINPEMSFMLTILFIILAFIFYKLIKLIEKRLK